MSEPLRIEHKIGVWVRTHLPALLSEFALFVLKQAWACLFGGLLLLLIILTALFWQEEWPLYRYDFLAICAVIIQAILLVFKFETWREAKVILIFHIVGTVMEIFKIHMGSWSYPEAGLLKIAGVPLFSGFMYASVGSYIARVIRLFHMQFAPYPPFWATGALAVAIYLNFFAHHFTYDIRLFLFIATILLFWRTRIWFFVNRNPRWMPLPVAAFLSSFALWVAENVGTMTGTWIYSGQAEFEIVGFAKLGSWYLLLYVSFFLVTLVLRDALYTAPQRPGPRPS